jgi:hypothetical protein
VGRRVRKEWVERLFSTSEKPRTMRIPREDFEHLFSTLQRPYTIQFENLEVDSFEAERNAFLGMRHMLLSDPAYRGKYVAILDGSVVDIDDDKVRLAKRVYEKHGYVSAYIDKVQEKRQVFELPSPEIHWK